MQSRLWVGRAQNAAKITTTVIVAKKHHDKAPGFIILSFTKNGSEYQDEALKKVTHVTALDTQTSPLQAHCWVRKEGLGLQSSFAFLRTFVAPAPPPLPENHQI